MERERALEIVRKRYNKEGVDETLAIAIETLIPELAETEDEQAIRIIKRQMCYDPDPATDEEREIVETWLEKQKEPCGYFLKRDEGESACSYLERSLTPKYRTIWYEACLEIKQKEQMLKEAVEGVVEWDNDIKELFVLIPLGDGFKDGDKVKIIIVKSDD